jgi:hypothetical protein
MRNSLVLMVAVSLAGCGSRSPAPLPYNAARESKLAGWMQSGEVWTAATNAAAGLHGTNREYYLCLLAGALDRQAVCTLTNLDSLGELARKIDTVKRGTARHPYTMEQLTEARRIKGAKD